MASLRRNRVMPTDGAISRFLYTILKQLDLKSIDWQEVADGMDITNGHAARMRFSRFKSQMEGVPATPRKPRTVTPRQKKPKPDKSSTAAEKKPKTELQPTVKAESNIKPEPSDAVDETQSIDPTLKQEPVVKEEDVAMQDMMVKEEPEEGVGQMWASPGGVDGIKIEETTVDPALLETNDGMVGGVDNGGYDQPSGEVFVAKQESDLKTESAW